MIEFRFKTSTATTRATNILKSLQQSLHELRCDCSPDESCRVEITEMPDHRIDVIVSKPRRVSQPGEWRPYTVVEGMYGRRFDKGTSAGDILKSLEQILGRVYAEPHAGVLQGPALETLRKHQ